MRKPVRLIQILIFGCLWSVQGVYKAGYNIFGLIPLYYKIDKP